MAPDLVTQYRGHPSSSASFLGSPANDNRPVAPRPWNPTAKLYVMMRPAAARGMDLTFATHLAASSESECQILNSTRNIYLLVVL
jgi:hypothetical protein